MASVFSFSRRATDSVTFFSWLPPTDRTPGSSPPCRGPSTMVMSRATSGRVSGLPVAFSAGFSAGLLPRPDSALSGASPDFFQQRQQVDRLQRMQVEHQAVAIFADRQQRKHLRPDLGLELDDQSNHAGLLRPARISLM